MPHAEPNKTDKTKLPDIPLTKLSENTKDFLLAYSGTGKTIPETMIEILDSAAAAAGFPTKQPA